MGDTGGRQYREGGAFNLLSLLVITPLVAFYLLRDWDLITTKLIPVAKAGAAKIREQAGSIDETWRRLSGVNPLFVWC